jgi:hypothetical protein
MESSFYSSGQSANSRTEGPYTCGPMAHHQGKYGPQQTMGGKTTMRQYVLQKKKSEPAGTSKAAATRYVHLDFRFLSSCCLSRRPCCESTSSTYISEGSSGDADANICTVEIRLVTCLPKTSRMIPNTFVRSPLVLLARPSIWTSILAQLISG